MLCLIAGTVTIFNLFSKKAKKNDQIVDISKYDLSQAGRFNLPVYIAILEKDDYKHGLNAIVVGDHVLKYEDWLIIDPQIDFIFERGKPNLPNSTLTICALVPISSSKKDSLLAKQMTIIRFKFDMFGKPNVDYYHPNLILVERFQNNI